MKKNFQFRNSVQEPQPTPLGSTLARKRWVTLTINQNHRIWVSHLRDLKGIRLYQNQSHRKMAKVHVALVVKEAALFSEYPI